MNKVVKKIRVWSAILAIIQLVIIAAFVVFYFLDLFEIKKYITDLYLIIAIAAFIVINVVYLWIVSLKIATIRYKSDLNAAEIIGEDMQEAYNFAQVGILITDEENTVLWSNDLFKERKIDLIDKNIFEWQPSLAILKDESSVDTLKISHNDKNYNVKLLKNSGVWIFLDTTELESSLKYQREQAPVVGVLAIDNYQDIIHDEEDYNDILTQTRTAIFEYAKKFGVLIRKTRDENYSLFCNTKSFEAMKADHFSLIDQAREISKNESIPLTISIGIATSFPEVVKLNELATSALEIAMSRGGDQVVVSAYGSDMAFYGGKTAAQEKRSRVKIRVLADSLLSLLQSSSNVLIMGHKDMDMDAFGACLGVKAMAERVNKPAKIVVDYKMTESKTRSAITSSFTKEELDDLIVSKKESESLVNNNTILVVCDVHIPNRTMHEELLEKVNKIVVIDHHLRAEKYIESPVFNHTDPGASSTCEILSEFIRFASISPRIELSPTYATIMLAGIFLDTSAYKNKATGIRTFEASSILKEFGADNVAADDLLKDDYEEYCQISSIVSNLQTPKYGIVYAIGPSDALFDQVTMAKAANTCLSMKGVHAAFTFGKSSNKEIKMSCRSDGSINVQTVAERLGGGGHFTAAAATFNTGDLAEVEAKLKEALSDIEAEE